MEQIIDRKRSSVQGREESLSAFVSLLTAYYAKTDISRKVKELVPALLRSVKSGDSEKETIVALKAIAITLITDPSEETYDAVYHPLNRIISDSGSLTIKTAAIHTLGTVAFYGGASLDETQEVMDMLLEIVESDGSSVEARDEASVVTAAIEEWGFLATQLEDIEDATEPAMDAFVEQLESGSADVQIAAGENIALLYEKSYTEQEEDEDAPFSEEETSDNAPSGNGAPKMIKRYQVYRREDQLKHTLESLARLSGRGVSKKDKKSIHTSFADILQTVEHPTRGPRYNAAINSETGRRYGSRLTIKINRVGEMRIDKWWKLHRLKGLRRVLQGGFVRHYQENEVIFESLPCVLLLCDHRNL